jgi:type II secretory pathway predicted ATPase ExeA
MTGLAALIQQHGIKAADLRRATAQAGRRSGQPLSAAAMSDLINHGRWPKETPEEALKQQIENYLTGAGISPAQLTGLWTEAATPAHSETKRPGKDGAKHKQAEIMIPPAEILTQDARKAFKLKFNPFEGLPKNPGDYYVTDNMRFAKEAINEAADLSVLRAIVGESGSGKTAIKRMFKWDMDSKTTLIEVLVTNMSDTDKRGGRVMPSAQIHTTIIRRLAGENARVKADSHDRQMQCRLLLQSESESGRKIVLIIDEAHDLHGNVIAHLKRIHELSDESFGMVLIGQPRLAAKLTPRLSPEIKEAGQRIPIETLKPLDVDEIAGYLDKRLLRVGATFGAVFSDDAPAAFAEHLTRREQQGRGPAVAVLETYPLAVGNLAVWAINHAASRGFDRVTPDIIKAAAAKSAAARGV